MSSFLNNIGNEMSDGSKQYVFGEIQQLLMPCLSDAAGDEAIIEFLSAWPPDLFAVTSHLLKNTGAYRYCLHPEYRKSTKSINGEITTGQSLIMERKAAGENWAASLNQELLSRKSSLSPISDSVRNFIESSKNVRMNMLRALDIYGHGTERLNDRQKNELNTAKSFLLNLIECHSIADVASDNFGLPGVYRDENCALLCLGNTLLNKRGTLSRLPKHKITVVPKLRTPRTGAELRNLSHHLHAEQTEIEVIWRFMPWAFTDKGQLHILAIPFPFELEEEAFDESVGFQRHTHGLFNFKPNPGDSMRTEHIKALVQDFLSYEAKAGKVHMVIFPEQAFTVEELKKFESELVKQKQEQSNSSNGEKTAKDGSLPIIISGATESYVKPENDYLQFPDVNAAYVSQYILGKWYRMSQFKHHRWSLDESQLNQYKVAGRLSVAKRWFENSFITQRRLTVVSCAPWLAVTPLICEDLVQQQPVAPIIRGIGPSLIVAMLLDGPQTEKRWPARYAGVLSQDPGSSVISLTATGMVNLARPSDDSDRRNEFFMFAEGFGRPRYFPIDKDYREKKADCELAYSVVIKPSSIEERTMDDRSDDGQAFSVKFSGSRPVHMTSVNSRKDTHGIESPDQQTNSTDKTFNDISEISQLYIFLELLVTLIIEEEDFDWENNESLLELIGISENQSPANTCLQKYWQFLIESETDSGIVRHPESSDSSTDEIQDVCKIALRLSKEIAGSTVRIEEQLKDLWNTNERNDNDIDENRLEQLVIFAFSLILQNWYNDTILDRRFRLLKYLKNKNARDFISTVESIVEAGRSSKPR